MNNDSKKVIPLSKGVNLYFAKANNHYLKNNIDKALEYYKRAVRIEPQNSVNHFNVASLLAEMGKYTESNKIFRYIVNKLDPQMVDCWFYMGLNYGQLQQFRKVKYCLDKYLKHSPEGEHSEQANDIVKALKNSDYDFEARSYKEIQKIQDLCLKGIELVEKGNYSLAEETFIDAININNRITAPINNLALTYYYQGNFEKAILESTKVLEIDKTNIHALCNLVGFYQEVNDEINLKKVVKELNQISTDGLTDDEIVKLAITQGNLGNDLKATRLLMEILQANSNNFKAIYFIAIAAFNRKKFSESKEKWKKLDQIEPGNPFSTYYLSLIEKITGNTKDFERLAYQIKVPYNSLLEIIKLVSESNLKDEEIDKYREDNSLFSSIVWALYKGDVTLKEPLIDLMISLNDGKYIGAVVDYCYDTKQKYNNRNYAFKSLLKAGYNFSAEEFWKTQVFRNQEKWTDNQKKVLINAIEQLQNKGELTQVYTAQVLWNDYVNKVNPIIKSVDTWTKALVGFVVRETNLDSQLFQEGSTTDKKIREKINRIKKVIYNNL